MSDQEPEFESNADKTPTDPPAAVQWMMQQAAAGQSAASLPVAAGDRLANSLAPGDIEKTLATRRKRVADALRGNDRLTAGLSGDAAEALREWGLALARDVVNDTAGLDDAAAEDVLQPRVRAVRRLMMVAAEGTAGRPDADEWLAQAAVALGYRFAPPDAAQQAALATQWRALAGRPAEQVAALRRFIEQPDSRT